VTGPFPRLYQCHCSLCRKQGGSASNTGLIVAADQFHWLAGEAHLGKWQRSTGFRSWFCERCGSTVPNPLRDMGYVWVPAGALDGAAPLEIGAQIHLSSRASWDRPAREVFELDAAPALAEFIDLLHGRTR
jgi:hypothetical protein